MPSTGPSTTACAVAILLASCGSTFADVSFTPLGDLPGGSFYSSAGDISSDGSVIIGISAAPSAIKPMAFRWTRETGMTALGALPAPVPDSWPLDISGDGRTVVGMSLVSSAIKPVKWIDGSGPIALPISSSTARAIGVSANREVIVGSDDLGLPEAVIWRGDQPVRYLGFLPGQTESRAMTVSHDGSLVVGWGEGPGVRRSAFRWTEADGMRPFDPPEAVVKMSIPDAFSDDGLTIVGRSTNFEACRWTAATGTVLLPDIDGVLTVHDAYAVSADGSTIGGSGRTDSTNEGFIWTLSGGTELAFDFFTRHGLDLSGWQITVIAGISANGKTFTGTGVHDGVTEAFVAVIPAPGTTLLLFAGFAASRRRAR